MQGSMRIHWFITAFLLLTENLALGQGLNRHYLLGYSTGVSTPVVSTRGKFQFDSTSYLLQSDSFKMAFRASQATISDNNGNLVISTNGCWIADATGDTMQNGSGLNPGNFSYGLNGWCINSLLGQPAPASSLLLPLPGVNNKYILLHETASTNSSTLRSDGLYYSLVDLSLNNGLGAVTIKNQNVLLDSLNHSISACKHANGRDWWIIVLKDSSDIVYTCLLTPSGFSSIAQQHMGYPLLSNYTGQPMFSFDGRKFATHHYGYLGSGPNFLHEIRINDFDRCTGQFSNPQFLTFVDSANYGLGLSFSPNSKYLYWSTFQKIFQLNTDTSDIAASIQQVATYDNYCFPYSFTCTDFWLMYLAANGKIYISSGNGVIDMHYIDQPDSGGFACDVQQHAIRLPCYTVRNHVNHPNYALGPVTGSVCDSLGVGVEELEQVRNVKIFPNPVKSGGTVTLYYELPQNKAGVFELRDAIGKIIYSSTLPPWSNIQNVQLPVLVPGLYHASIRAKESRLSVKILVQ